MKQYEKSDRLMEAETIQKDGAFLKSRMSRGNFKLILK